MNDDYLLDRLDSFFGEGVNTDAIGGLLYEDQDVMQCLDSPNDSPEGLKLYSLFRRYSSIVENLIRTFVEREKVSGGAPVSLEQITAAVMNEWKQPQDSCRYLCTAYIAGALDFESFKQLAADANEMMAYPVGDELDEEGSSENTNEDDDDNDDEDVKEDIE